MTRGRRLAIAWLAPLCAAGLALYVAQHTPTPRVRDPSAPSARLDVVVSAPDGAPAAGAGIELAAGGTVQRAHADAQGRARFEQLAAGEAELRVSLPGAAGAERALTLAPGDNRMRVELAEAVRISGVVIDDAGATIAGAEVAVQREAENARGDSRPRETKTDAEGRFALDGLEAGGYALRVRASHHELAVVPALQTPLAEPLRVVLERTSRLHGQVLDAQGEPASAATVTIAGSGVWPPKQLRADDTGHFSLEPVPSGVYELRARSGTAVSEPVEGVVVAPASGTEVNLRIEPGAALRGRVFDAEDGSPLSDLKVTLIEDALSGAPFEAETDAEGRFVFEGLRKTPHRVWIQAPGYVAVAGRPEQPGEDAREFALRRAAVLSGEVVNELGEAMANVALEVAGTTTAGDPVRVLPPAPVDAPGPYGIRVIALPPAGDSLGVVPGTVPKVPLFAPPIGAQGEPLVPQSGFMTDAAGRFRIEGVPAGRIEVVARHAGYAPSRSAPHPVAAGAQVGDLRIVLARGAILIGRLVDAGGQPVANVLVQLEIEGEPARATLTGGDGRFQFDAVRGRCTLTASAQGAPPVRERVELESGERREVVLTLAGENRELAGRVLDERGFPVESATIRVQSLDTRFPVSRNGVSGADGTFRVSGLPSPPYSVAVEHPDYAAARLSRVAPDLRQELKVELRAGARVHGLALDRMRNQGIASARVRLRGGKQPRSARTDTQGRFEFRNVLPGKYEILIDANGYVSARSRVVLQGADARELDPIVLGPAGRVSGDVVDRLGAPVFDAEVAVGSPAQWGRAVRTDHRGHFELAGLEPGEHWISARHAQAGASPQPTVVRVYPLQESPGLVLRLPTAAE